jgi:hypothetical protein
MADSFNGELDPVEGFLPSRQEYLNQLPSMRLFVTWFDNNPVHDKKRTRNDVFALSTESKRYLPYRPMEVEPVIQSENTGPFRYIHNITSNMHDGEPLELIDLPARELNKAERETLSSCLELNLYEDDLAKLRAYLDQALDDWQNIKNNIENFSEKEINEHIEKIYAVMLSFREFQYNLDTGNTASVADVIEFLDTDREGDCVKFSNSLAMLGRIAGIPSRVVTGFLADESLQTEAHLRGLDRLQKTIPVLQDFPFEDLFLVTDLHAHSWTQFYIPEYGWLDFDGTSFAIPPIGFGDFNEWDVVIPIIDPDKDRLLTQVRNFPWMAVLTAFGWFLAAALFGVYLFRYTREAVLYIGVKRGGRDGARSLYLLLLAKLAAEGKPIKPASKTASEYAQLFPDTDGEFGDFAQLYSRLRWRQFEAKAECDACFLQLLQAYKKILCAQRRHGVPAFFKRIFSLRGLSYSL